MKDERQEKLSLAYKNYYLPLVKYAYYRVSSWELAEEITQEAFLKTWVYVKKQKNKEVYDFKNFLYKVTKNLIIDYYKQREKIREISIDEINPKELQKKYTLLEEQIDNKSRYKYLIKTIGKLEKKYQKILTYRFVNQLSINKICDKTGMSPNYVSVMIYRGINTLKEKIKQKPKRLIYAK